MARSLSLLILKPLSCLNTPKMTNRNHQIIEIMIYLSIHVSSSWRSAFVFPLADQPFSRAATLSAVSCLYLEAVDLRINRRSLDTSEKRWFHWIHPTPWNLAACDFSLNIRFKRPVPNFLILYKWVSNFFKASPCFNAHVWTAGSSETTPLG